MKKKKVKKKSKKISHYMVYKLSQYLGFEVLTVMVMKSFIHWDIKSCSLLSQPMLRRNMSPPFSGSKISQARNKHETGGKHSNRLHGVIF
jgi:hypothetical protein